MLIFKQFDGSGRQDGIFLFRVHGEREAEIQQY
jgi:hypothetical protein